MSAVWWQGFFWGWLLATAVMAAAALIDTFLGH